MLKVLDCSDRNCGVPSSDQLPAFTLPLAALSSRGRPGLSLLSAAHLLPKGCPEPRVGLRLCLSLVSLAPQELEVWKEVFPKSDPVNLSWKSLGKTVSSGASFSQRNSFCRERPGQEALSPGKFQL